MAEGPREPYFAEYSLWNDSAYSVFTIPTINYNCIEFTQPIAGSVFLSPEEDRSSDEVDEDKPTPEVNTNPGFERYIKRALKVVTREDLMRDPALFKTDPDSDDESNADHLDKEIFLHPPRPRWRSAQQINGRGRRHLMQRKLEQALTQPPARGQSTKPRVQGDGRGSNKYVEKVTPDPYYVQMLNAAYESYCQTAAPLLAPSPDSAADSPDSGSEYKPLYVHKNRRIRKQEFNLNVLQFIREFVRNDLQVELFFESKLKPHERKRIHDIVNKLMGKESAVVFDSMEMVYLAEDIELRNAYRLGTQSEGDSPNRQMCIYKEAAEHMFLITPDDVRYADYEEEETNPFLKSIVRHLKTGDKPPKEYTMLDRIIDFFMEFACTPKYTEFRFLGPYNMGEIDLMSSFFGMVSCLVEKRPYLDYTERLVRAFEQGLDYRADSEDPNVVISPVVNYPDRLVQAFEKGVEFVISEDANGFASIKKRTNKKQDKNDEAQDKEETPS